MVMDWGISLQSGPGGISAPTRLMTRVAALAVWLGMGVALLSTQPPSLPSIEPIGVAAVRLEPLERPPRVVIRATDISSELPDTVLKPARAISPSGGPFPLRPPRLQNKRVATLPARTDPAGLSGGPTAGALGGVALAQPAASGPSQARNGAGGRSFSASSQAILRAQACAQIDLQDRPPDCPPNAELKRLLERARGPKYRPENAEGFSRNELRWRDIPPPCLEDGQKMKMTGTGGCVRFGNTPSRVRSPHEICEAKGLGGCAPVPSQAAVNAAAKQAQGQ